MIESLGDRIWPNESFGDRIWQNESLGDRICPYSLRICIIISVVGSHLRVLVLVADSDPLWGAN